jgi:hypothetical protein
MPFGSPLYLSKSLSNPHHGEEIINTTIADNIMDKIVSIPIIAVENVGHTRTVDPVKTVENADRTRTVDPIKKVENADPTRTVDPVKKVENDKRMTTDPVKTEQNADPTRTVDLVKMVENADNKKTVHLVKKVEKQALQHRKRVLDFTARKVLATTQNRLVFSHRSNINVWLQSTMTRNKILL